MVLAAILAGALFAGSLVRAVGSEVLLGVGFGVGFLLATAAVVGVASARSPARDVWVGIAVAAAFLMIPVRSGVPALERTHLFEYGLLATLVYAALVERRAQGRSAPAPAALAVAASALVGWLDESLQGLLPDRVYDLRDVGVNALAALVAVGFVAALRQARRR